MAKRLHENVFEKAPLTRHFGSGDPKHIKLDTDEYSATSELPSDNEELNSDSGGSILDLSEEEFSSGSNNLSSDSSCASVDESVFNNETSGLIEENSWTIVNPPEPAIDITSKFTVTNVGPCNIPKSRNPMDFFSLFLTEELLISMVQNTNQYAKYSLEKEPNLKSLKHWYDVTLDEMKKFWSILINMGLSQRNRYKDFWSTHPVLSFPFFDRVMPLRRFESILSMFSLRNPYKIPSDLDPVMEVGILLRSFNSSFKHYFLPDQELRLDDSLISKQNRDIIKYRPKKYLSSQGGIVKFEICDASSEYIIYVGLRRFRSGIKGRPKLSKNVVFELLNEADLTGKGYHLFIRKAYMDLGLSQKLLTVNTFMTGPIDKTQHKYFPSAFIRNQIKLETTLYARSGDHLLIKYNNQKPVCMTTGGRAENQSTVNAKCQQRVKPLIVRRYLKHMSGKDKSSLHVTCTIAMNSYWKKIAFNLIDLAIFNSYILFKLQKDVKSTYSRQTFLEEIVRQLSYVRPIVVNPVHKLFLEDGHRLTRVNIKTVQICRVCRREGKKVKFICPACNVYVHERCFRHLEHILTTKEVQRSIPVAVLKSGHCINVSFFNLVSF